MSVNIRPPIFILNRDILLDIVSMNADMFVDADALSTTRMTSQVCRAWRNVMLATPSLWARLIDVDCIPYICSDEWLNELIRRSENAPLWIRASTFRPPTYISKFLDVIKENWHRIQKLILHGFFPSINLFLLPWSIPAPELETFHMTIDRRIVADENMTAKLPPLFGGYAPMLRSFDIKNYIVDQREPWLSGLRSLTLQNSYGVRHALGILSTAHNLQHLKVMGLSHDVGNTTAGLPVISPTYLDSVAYYGNALPCIMLLDHVKISPDCNLSIDVNAVSEGLTFTTTKALITQFTRHTRNFLRSNTLPLIFIHYIPGHLISFEGQNLTSYESLQRLKIPLDYNDVTKKHVVMMKELALLDFSKTEVLQFFSENNAILDPSFGLFFSSLDSINTIYTDSDSLNSLIALQNHMDTTNQPGIILPSLQTINFTVLSLADSGFEPEEQIAVAEKFILSRVQNGHPISLLDMWELPIDADFNLDALTEIQDLEVVYTRVEEAHAEEGEICEYTW